MKGAVSAQKAPQGSKTEAMEFQGRTEVNSVSQQGVIDFAYWQINDLYLKEDALLC